MNDKLDSPKVPDFLQEAEAEREEAKRRTKRKYTEAKSVNRPIEWRRAKLEPFLRDLVRLLDHHKGHREAAAVALSTSITTVDTYLSSSPYGAWMTGRMPTSRLVERMKAALEELPAEETPADPVVESATELTEIELSADSDSEEQADETPWSGILSEEEHLAQFGEPKPPAVPTFDPVDKEGVSPIDNEEIPQSAEEQQQELNLMNAFAVFQDPKTIEETPVGTLEEVTGLWLQKHPETGMLYLRGTSKTKNRWGRTKFTRFVITPATDRMSTYTGAKYPSYRLCLETID